MLPVILHSIGCKRLTICSRRGVRDALEKEAAHTPPCSDSEDSDSQSSDIDTCRRRVSILKRELLQEGLSTPSENSAEEASTDSAADQLVDCTSRCCVVTEESSVDAKAKKVAIDLDANTNVEFPTTVDEPRSTPRMVRKDKPLPLLINWTYLQTGQMAGDIYQSDEHSPGESVTTDCLAKYDMRTECVRPKVETKSGKVYLLGNPSAEQVSEIQSIVFRECGVKLKSGSSRTIRMTKDNLDAFFQNV